MSAEYTRFDIKAVHEAMASASERVVDLVRNGFADFVTQERVEVRGVVNGIEIQYVRMVPFRPCQVKEAFAVMFSDISDKTEGTNGVAFCRPVLPCYVVRTISITDTRTGIPFDVWEAGDNKNVLYLVASWGARGGAGGG